MSRPAEDTAHSLTDIFPRCRFYIPNPDFNLGASVDVFFFLLLLLSTWMSLGVIMLAAVKKGDAKELAELMRQDPGFDVNMDQDGNEWTLLHYACSEDSRSPVIPLLVAHPDIDVNVKDVDGWTPFYCACNYGFASCVREMLKDSRVKVNEPSKSGQTPLYCAADWRSLPLIKWWIASGREMDLGTPGDVDQTDAIGVAKKIESWYNEATKMRKTEVATLLERFKENPVETRHAVRVELGLLDELAAEMFALVVFVSDGLLQVKNPVETTPPSARFFRIASQLPLELQMVMCYRFVDSCKEIISGKDSEAAFKELTREV